MKKIKLVIMLLSGFVRVCNLQALPDETNNSWTFSVIPTGILIVEVEAGYKGLKLIELVNTTLFSSFEGGYECTYFYKDASTVPMEPVLPEEEILKAEVNRMPLVGNRSKR